MQKWILEADAAIDLQMHTFFSDGLWTVAALLDHLIAEQFALAAITDHDRVDIMPMLLQVAAEKGFWLLTALEISTQWHGELVDVLCYGFDPSAKPLVNLMEQHRRRQWDNIVATVKAIRQQGYVVHGKNVEAILTRPVVQQPQSLVNLMRQKGIDAAGRLLVDAGLEQITLDIGEAVDAAHRSGGVCLIAHPGRGDGYLCFDDALLDQLRAEAPIDGVEVYYPKHTPEQIAAYQAYTEQHDLLVSAGSDSHTPDKPPIKYRAAWCRKLLNRLGIEVLES